MKTLTDVISFKGHLIENDVTSRFSLKIHPISEKMASKIAWEREKNRLLISLPEYIKNQWEIMDMNCEKFYEGQGKDIFGEYDALIGLSSHGNIPTFSTPGNLCYFLKRYWEKKPEDFITLYLGEVRNPGNVVGHWHIGFLSGGFDMKTVPVHSEDEKYQ